MQNFGTFEMKNSHNIPRTEADAMQICTFKYTAKNQTLFTWSMHAAKCKQSKLTSKNGEQVTRDEFYRTGPWSDQV